MSAKTRTSVQSHWLYPASDGFIKRFPFAALSRRNDSCRLAALGVERIGLRHIELPASVTSGTRSRARPIARPGETAWRHARLRGDAAWLRAGQRHKGPLPDERVPRLNRTRPPARSIRWETRLCARPAMPRRVDGKDEQEAKALCAPPGRSALRTWTRLPGQRPHLVDVLRQVCRWTKVRQDRRSVRFSSRQADTSLSQRVHSRVRDRLSSSATHQKLERYARR